MHTIINFAHDPSPGSRISCLYEVSHSSFVIQLVLTQLFMAFNEDS